MVAWQVFLPSVQRFYGSDLLFLFLLCEVYQTWQDLYDGRTSNCLYELFGYADILNINGELEEVV